jgi:NAD(P)-dependent dehydrogenase (short-subunit alcohol dehydrogenase family)
VAAEEFSGEEDGPVEMSQQRVVVIGGTSGIGFAVADAAARAGAEVVVAARTQEKLDRAVSRLPAGTTGRPLDVTDEDSVGHFFSDLGEFDHLVYTAGDHLRMQALNDISVAKAKGCFDTLYWGALTAAKHAAPGIRAAGSMVFTSGVIAVHPAPATLVQAGVAGAVESMIRTLAVELAPVRVNGVRLGPVPTVPSSLPNEEELYRVLAGQLLTGRVGTPAEAAAAYLYLLRGTFTTGAILPADGGYTLVAHPFQLHAALTGGAPR